MVKVVLRSQHRRHAELGGGVAVEEYVEHEVLEVEALRHRPARHPGTREMTEQEMGARVAMGHPQTEEGLPLPLPLVHHLTRPTIPIGFAQEGFSHSAGLIISAASLPSNEMITSS